MKLIFLSLLSCFYISINAQTSISITQTFKQFTDEGFTNRDMTKSARSMISFSEKQETEGSQYLLGKWVNGVVYLKNKQVLAEPTAILNFDKMNNILIMKISDQQVMNIDMSQIAGFKLQDNSNTYTLTTLPGNEQSYVLELYKDSAYSLYKSLNTKFYKADYVNKGLYETGYKYDRYVDENTYYIKMKDGSYIGVNALTKADRKKIIEKIPAAAEFFKKENINPNENIENVMNRLVMYLNKQTSV